jgi:hypothetical protein
MREQINSTSTEQTADNRPLTDAELNGVSGGVDHGEWGTYTWRSDGTFAGISSEPLAQNITTAVWMGGFSNQFLPFGAMM